MTPAMKQIIPIKVIAQSNKGGYAAQEFEVKVSSTNGTISGTVTDTLGLPIKKVLINVLKRDARMPFFYSTITDSLGKYRITGLDRGTYLVHAVPLNDNYLDQWYDGKSSPLDATPIILDSIATVNFILRSKIEPPLFTVRGKVSDTLELPLSVHGVRVFFVNADFALNTNTVRQNIDFNHDIDFRMEGESRFAYQTGVDSQGVYSLQLPAGRYIAYAKASDYFTAFYKDKSTYLEADIINLAGDSSGIDFRLTPLPPISSGSISGQVLDTVKNLGVRSRMVAFRGAMTFARDDRHLIHSFFTETDSLGSYNFTNLPPGLYIILAVPVGNYAPVFYNDGTEGLQWNKATRITIDGNSVSGINLYPYALPDSARGYTMIRGSVTNSDNGNAPIGGAFVYASNSDGSLAGYAVTDAQGTFVIDELSPGSYTVSSDITGYNALSSAHASPSYDAQGKAVIATVSLSLQTVTSVKSGAATLPTKYILSQNYPNPFNPNTRISFEIPSRSQVTLKVYNIIGQEVAMLVNSTFNAGRYIVDFDASHLSTGVYFYRIKAGDFSSTMKMILMK
jgi:protocatechuate 3,4-dioxygenase beta subunit